VYFLYVLATCNRYLVFCYCLCYCYCYYYWVIVIFLVIIAKSKITYLSYPPNAPWVQCVLYNILYFCKPCCTWLRSLYSRATRTVAGRLLYSWVMPTTSTRPCGRWLPMCPNNIPKYGSIYILPDTTWTYYPGCCHRGHVCTGTS
jgi:hypothetical protein